MRTLNGKWLLFVVISLWVSRSPAQQQVSTGSLHGTVVDPSGALVPSAKIVISDNSGFSKSAASGRDGTFAAEHLLPGHYTLRVTVRGFADETVQDVQVFSGKSTGETIKLHLPVEQQQVSVNDQGLSINTGADSNASAIVIKGKDLDGRCCMDRANVELSLFPADLRSDV
jgi:hypothetical protein